MKSEKKEIIGYTADVYDLFHMSHLNLSRDTKDICDKLIIGDDRYSTDKWKAYEKEAEENGIKIIYFPYIRSISSTKIREALKNGRGWTRTEDGKSIGEKKD